MIDLLISYFNFLLLTLNYIVKRLTFRPPKPPGYIIIKESEDSPEEILFFRQKKGSKHFSYVEIDFRLLDYIYMRIRDNKTSTCIPILLLKPINHYQICIIYCHGNSGDLGLTLIESYDISVNTNCLLVDFEYPGYGILKDQPLYESEVYKNLQITYKFVTKNLKYKPNQIIIYGFSLGTGIAFDLACREEFPVAGLILQAPFLSLCRVFYNSPKTYFFDMFSNIDKAKSLKTPTFFIHGNKDEIIPYIHGRILAKLIPKQYYYDFLTVDKAGHNNLFKNRDNKNMVYEKIRNFISACTSIPMNKFKKDFNEDTNSQQYKTNNIINNNNDYINDNKIRNIHRNDILSPPFLYHMQERNINNLRNFNNFNNYYIQNDLSRAVNNKVLKNYIRDLINNDDLNIRNNELNKFGIKQTGLNNNFIGREDSNVYSSKSKNETGTDSYNSKQMNNIQSFYCGIPSESGKSIIDCSPYEARNLPNSLRITNEHFPIYKIIGLNDRNDQDSYLACYYNNNIQGP